MASAIDRRTLLTALPFLAGAAHAAPTADPALGRPTAFDFQRLRAEARRRAGQPYSPPTPPPADILDRLDYQAWGQIHFDPDRALFRDTDLPVTFFHLGQWFRKPVRIFAVEGGQAREIPYDPADFDMPAGSPARRLGPSAGFAGFRVQEPRNGKLDWRKNDWVAFLGGCYFRAIGELYQYGLSARAVAVNSAVYGRPEEFPDFTRIYIEKPAPGSDEITVCALLEGPSIVGACRFKMTRGRGVIIDVDQSLHLRRDVARLGIAPLTSMYWFSETVKAKGADWRPEVHDSDGLEMWTGAGERLWRPLNNPPSDAVSAFQDENPRGFGLMQRDRNFDHYLDGVFYDRRPSLWVEPKGSWGKGSVQLIELPTRDEIEDNVVAAWVPQAPARAGQAFELSYRLYWLADQPHPAPLARCVATRMGLGGQPGLPRPPGVRKFVVEFLGGPLTDLPFGVLPQMVLSTSRGRLTDYRFVEPVPDGVAGHWRAQFDLADVSGPEPAELRLELLVGGRPASETWLYQYHPFLTGT
jgi:glucans biosynthesis protein